MAEISATVVTLNEEENIRGCLETLTWCDEIVIVDSHSDDRTVEIAREYTDQIYTYERTGYGDPAREKALEEASGDWICMVDADEMVPRTLANQLRSEAEREIYDVIYAPRMNFSLGKWIDGAGWWPDYRPILYRKSVVTYSETIHNFISFDDSATESKLEPEKGNAVRHFNHTDIENKLSRVNRYTTVEATQTEFSYTQLLLTPPAEFVKRLIIQRGYRLGWHGLLLAIFQAWYQWLIAIKSWEIKNMGGKEGIKDSYNEKRDEMLNEWK
ncbi:MAG: glycosyltransferase family 2 protein [Halobacteriaceae archaeon]